MHKTIPYCLTARLSLLSAVALLGLGTAANAQTLYVANNNDSTLEKFNSAGVGAQFNVSGDVNAPGGLAIDSAGNLYVGNGGDNTIEEFNSLGIGARFNVSGDISNPDGLAPAATPEPGSLALLAGMASTGMALLRRRRK